MPLYEYECCACGYADDEFQHIRDDRLTICPKCGKDTYQKMVSLPHTDLKEYHTPIEMYSIGLNDEAEIRAFKQQCPDVEVSEDLNDEMWGIPIARTRKQKLAALKAIGFEEKN